MFVLGTLYMISETWSTQAGFVDYREYPGGPLGFASIVDSFPLGYLASVVYVIADWFADAVLVCFFILWRILLIYNGWFDFRQLWRCIVIWRGSHLRPIIILPSLLYLCSVCEWCLYILHSTSNYISLLALSIVLLAQIDRPTDLLPTFDSSTPCFVVSLVNTMLISGLIVLRILLERRWILTTAEGFEDQGKEYVSIAAIIIESAALYSIFSLAFLVTFLPNYPLAAFFLPVLSQVQVSLHCFATKITSDGWIDYCTIVDHIPRCARGNFVFDCYSDCSFLHADWICNCLSGNSDERNWRNSIEFIGRQFRKSLAHSFIIWATGSF